METLSERPPDAWEDSAPPDGLSFSSDVSPPPAGASLPGAGESCAPTLGSLPVGARLILRCRADWRAATVAAFDPDRGRVVLNVASPGGHTYRVRRPTDAPLAHDGHLPVLGEGCWRAGLARYDRRW